MPSFTFVTAAQVVVLRGATPVFIDINASDFNLDPDHIAQAISARTRAIMPMHYAGVPCDMERIIEIAQRHDLDIIEDAAQGVLSKDDHHYLGTRGRFGCLSFHETKNLSGGEGGILLINRGQDMDRAEVIRDKGTNRKRFNLGLVDKYTWSDVGLSFMPPEITAALLFSQLERGTEITEVRRQIWHRYYHALTDVAAQYHIQLPAQVYNAHIFYCVFEHGSYRDKFIQALRSRGASSVFHYAALHSSPMGQQFGRAVGDLPQTSRAAECLTRLPLWYGLEQHLDVVIDAVIGSIHEAHA
jgi:dTDP-4-amino-4,6-dideoxygalactose transaminase